MIDVVITPIKPLYKKENGLYVQEIDRVDLPVEFTPTVRHLVTIPPGKISANHKHTRTEAFIGIGSNLIFYWLDSNGILHEKAMNENDDLLLFRVASFVPHAIKNYSDCPAVLLEYANQPQNFDDVTDVKVI